jgi:hypothetical protein
VLMCVLMILLPALILWYAWKWPKQKVWVIDLMNRKFLNKWFLLYILGWLNAISLFYLTKSIWDSLHLYIDLVDVKILLQIILDLLYNMKYCQGIKSQNP